MANLTTWQNEGNDPLANNKNERPFKILPTEASKSHENLLVYVDDISISKLKGPHVVRFLR